MFLPWAGDGESVGLERVDFIFQQERHLACFKADQFNPFVAVGVQPPILMAHHIPVAHTAESLKMVFWNERARIVPPGDPMELAFLLLEGLFLGDAGVYGALITPLVINRGAFLVRFRMFNFHR